MTTLQLQIGLVALRGDGWRCFWIEKSIKSGMGLGQYYREYTSVWLGMLDCKNQDGYGKKKLLTISRNATIQCQTFRMFQIEVVKPNRWGCEALWRTAHLLRLHRHYCVAMATMKLLNLQRCDKGKRYIYNSEDSGKHCKQSVLPRLRQQGCNCATFRTRWRM